MQILNEKTPIMASGKMTPLEAYEGDNYSNLLQQIFKERPHLHSSLYETVIPLSKKQSEKVYKYELGEYCQIDSTGIKPSLQKPIIKISEQRVKVWHRGKIVGRKLVDSSSRSLVQRYLVRIPALGVTRWTYRHRLKKVD